MTAKLAGTSPGAQPWQKWSSEERRRKQQQEEQRKQQQQQEEQQQQQQEEQQQQGQGQQQQQGKQPPPSPPELFQVIKAEFANAFPDEYKQLQVQMVPPKGQDTYRSPLEQGFRMWICGNPKPEIQREDGGWKKQKSKSKGQQQETMPYRVVERKVVELALQQQGSGADKAEEEVEDIWALAQSERVQLAAFWLREIRSR
jgi:hypothetical protein